MPRPSSISNFKRWGGLALFALLVVLGVSAGGRAYQNAAAQNTINAFTAQRYRDFYDLPEGDVDLLFLGSSHSYCTFDPANFPGWSAYQLGTPLQHPDTSYYALRDALEHQSPRVVVQEVYWDMLDDDFDLKQVGSFFEVLENEPLRREYIQKVFPLAEKAKYRIAAIRFQSDYFAYASAQLQKELGERFGVEKPAAAAGNGVEYYLARGYVYCDTVMPPAEYDETNQFKGMEGKSFAIAASQKKYLTQLAELCAERGIALVFVTAPIAPVSLDYIADYDAIHQQVAALAAELNVPYLDYNQLSLGLQNNVHFRDDAHLNDTGVKAVDEHFSAWLSATLQEQGFPQNAGF